MRRAVIVTLDGLRRDFVSEALTSNLMRFSMTIEDGSVRAGHQPQVKAHEQLPSYRRATGLSG
jgi:hypothetical protein